METVIIEIAIIVSFLATLTTLLWVVYRRRRAVAVSLEDIEGAVRRLVEAAEQIHNQPGSGSARFGWVMNRPTKRFPDVEWEDLAECVEATVVAMRRSQAQRAAAMHRNGVVSPHAK